MKASVIVVTWNGRELLRKNLPAVLAQSQPDYEVVVVDNGSADGSVELLDREFPGVRVVRLPENRGFAGGNNAALPFCRGEYLVRLNNDARPEPDWLGRLVAAADANPRVGVVASKLVEEGGLLDSAGDRYLTSWAADKRGVHEPPASFDRADGIFGACGGAALYRRRLVDEIGFFEEDFFLIYEDVDLSFRARLMGWEVVYVPGAVVHHAVGASVDRVPDLKLYYQYRNSEYVWIRNVPGRLLWKHAPVAVLQRLVEVWEAWRLRGRFRIYLRAKRDVLLNLPRLLAQRRRLQRSRRAGPDQIERAMSPVRLMDGAHWREEIRKVLRWG